VKSNCATYVATLTLILGFIGTQLVVNSEVPNAFTIQGHSNPYIDFRNTDTDDFDIRLQLNGDNNVRLEGGRLQSHDDFGDPTFFTEVGSGAFELFSVGPLIDLKNDFADDIDVRLILNSDDQIAIQGGQVLIEEAE
jgi:hypothetical protein